MAAAVNQHFLAVCLAIYAGCTLAGILPAAAMAARARQPAMALVAVVVALTAAAVLANGAADLW